MKDAAEYRRTIGILDATGKRHKIDSYLSLRVGDYDQLMDAVWLTGAVGVGVHFPQSAFEQFDEAVPWSVVPGSPIKGGHYIPVYDRDESSGNLICITFGHDQPMTRGFYENQNDETAAYISIERLVNKVSPEAFDFDRLMAMVANL
jgi:hypothetical protein